MEARCLQGIKLRYDILNLTEREYPLALMTVRPKKKKSVYASLSITHRSVELAVVSPKNLALEQSAILPIPEGVFDQDGDRILNPALLKEMIGQVLRDLKPRPAMVHLSLPGTLLRMVEMPKIDANGLYVSLSSEAERYKTFDDTEAVVDFVTLEAAHAPANQQQVVFGAVRSDSLAVYLKILRDMRMKPASIGLEPLNVLRAMAGTGVLDSLVQQIGSDAHWGMIFVEATRVRFSLWQCNRLVELRETAINTSEFSTATDDDIVVEDMMEELRRTTKNAQPTLWLTHQMPPNMAQILSTRMGCPFRDAPLGPTFVATQPIDLATVGSSLSSMVSFPFDFDIGEGLSRSGGMATSNSALDAAVAGDDDPKHWLIPAGVGAMLLALLLTGGLYVWAMMVSQQLPSITSKRDSAKMEVSGLESRQRELKKKAELDQSLLELVNQGKMRNRIYVALTDDLKRKTPQQLWIQTLKVNEGLELSGKGMNHNAVIHFAQSFDDAPYTKAVLIDSIKEDRLNGTIIYNFKISGGIQLTPSLLEPPATAVSPTANSPSSPHSSGAANAGQSGV